MERWNVKAGRNIETTEIDDFIAEILEVCKKHGLSISHEDGHGAFEIERYCEGNANSLRYAHDAT